MEEASKILASKQEKIDAATKKKAEKRRAANRKRQEAEKKEEKRQAELAWERYQNQPYCQHCNDEEGINCAMCRQH